MCVYSTNSPLFPVQRRALFPLERQFLDTVATERQFLDTVATEHQFLDTVATLRLDRDGLVRNVTDSVTEGPATPSRPNIAAGTSQSTNLRRGRAL